MSLKYRIKTVFQRLDKNISGLQRKLELPRSLSGLKMCVCVCVCDLYLVILFYFYRFRGYKCRFIT